MKKIFNLIKRILEMSTAKILINLALAYILIITAHALGNFLPAQWALTLQLIMYQLIFLNFFYVAAYVVGKAWHHARK
jgi:hypothetical protein